MSLGTKTMEYTRMNLKFIGNITISNDSLFFTLEIKLQPKAKLINHTICGLFINKFVLTESNAFLRSVYTASSPISTDSKMLIC